MEVYSKYFLMFTKVEKRRYIKYNIEGVLCNNMLYKLSNSLYYIVLLEYIENTTVCGVNI
ncbi:hypothetical protein bsdE14_13700 [Clostridium omnivorum]|uniref:Uncharacterized protein n=1 Tax=Clostridium omnivorum TaxID=1604902 RepID=A0ABQ5N463_9CLOT|nr:hypothetical protein bsdE14_13700 [Clostridium sp. E14]